jgi:hypothetical protein
MRTKTFDCVELKRRGAKRVLKKIRGKTREEQLKFWHQGTAELRRLKEKLDRKS